MSRQSPGFEVPAVGSRWQGKCTPVVIEVDDVAIGRSADHSMVYYIYVGSLGGRQQRTVESFYRTFMPVPVRTPLKAQLEDSLVHQIVLSIVEEVIRARAKYPKFNSAHEGLAVIEEEFIELREEVFKNPTTRSYTKMRTEAKQLAAMAIRFLADVDAKHCADDAKAACVGKDNQ